MDNADGSVPPGAYVQVTLALTAEKASLSLPANTLLFRPAGVAVATVNSKGCVQLMPVTLGRDFGTRVEIRAGLRGSERVVVNPGDAISDGQPVSINAHPADAT
jgi:multidrug efflux pump subunit AcrA (membrane-fusion protein)